MKRLCFMEDDDTRISSDQFNVNGDLNPDVLTTISRMRNLPDSLIVEILARLPLKTIFSSKLVCKHWKSLISHPSFRRFYFWILYSNAASSALSFRILYRFTYLSNFKELLDRLLPEICTCSEFSVLYLFSLEGQRPHQFRVLAMSNGLILCCLWSSTQFVYYVCDPVTRQWIILPSKSRFQLFFGEGLLTRVNQDHMLTDYTVVRIKFSVSRSNHLNLEMFSSERGDWVRYKLACVSPIQLLNREDGAPIHCYGAFHWLTHDHGMVAFDPYKDPKSLRLIPLPNDRDVESEYNHNGVFHLCDEWQGILRYFEVAHDPIKFNLLTMWSMKDYEKGEWLCEFKVRRSDLHCSDPELSNWLLIGTFLPISFHPLNLKVVYLRCIELGWIVSYDVVNRKLDVACKLNGSFEDENLSWRMVIPFLLPRWPHPLPATPRSVSPPPPPPRPPLTQS